MESLRGWLGYHVNLLEPVFYAHYDLSFNLGIPQQNTNKLKDKIFGIECNFEELRSIQTCLIPFAIDSELNFSLETIFY